MKYKAKECFMIVDGMAAGTSYTKDAVYDAVPSGYDIYFEEIKPDAAETQTTLTVEPYSKPSRTKTPAPETGCVKPKEETENKEVIEL